MCGKNPQTSADCSRALSFYEQRQTGDMVVRLASDIDAAEDFISSAVLGIVLNILILVGMTAVMFYLDWRFSLIGLSVAPALFVVVYRFSRRIKRAIRAVKKKESELASVGQESISSARVVKAFAWEDFEEEPRAAIATPHPHRLRPQPRPRVPENLSSRPAQLS